jgi:probable metal-binding protein
MRSSHPFHLEGVEESEQCIRPDERPVPVIMQNKNQVHGHEVMHMMLDSGVAYTRNSLRQAIIKRFGSDTRFFTCSAEGLTADALIDFLASRGKFTETTDGFTTDPAKVCQHDAP